MSRQEKLLARLKSLPNDFTWAELERLLAHFGYEVRKGSGSRRKFIAEGLPLIALHEPHPKQIVKVVYLKQILELLENEGLLS